MPAVQPAERRSSKTCGGAFECHHEAAPGSPGRAGRAGAVGGSAPALFAVPAQVAEAPSAYRQGVGRSYDTVSFLSDFGTADEFVGVVKAVIRDLARHVTVLDLTHEIPPHDVRAGSLALVRAIQYLPSGVVVAVVDPGVGTQRRAIAVEVAGGEGVLVGPDNGLLAPAAAMAGGAERAVSLTDTSYHLAAPGATFAGRDVFAPVAAHLCNGVDLAELGEAVDPVTLLPQVVPVSREEGGELVGEVLWVDRFGNAQLNVGPEDVDGWGDQIQLRFGDTVRTARPRGLLRPDRRRHRAGGRLLRAPGREPRPEIGRRRAPPRHGRRGAPGPAGRARPRRRRHAGVLPAPFLGRPADGPGPTASGRTASADRRHPAGGLGDLSLAD